MSNYSKIILKNSTVTNAVPIPSFLDTGEVALNNADGALYFKDSAGNVRRFEAVYTLRLAADLSATSTTAVLSTESVTIPPGIYEYNGIIYGTTASTTRGISCGLLCDVAPIGIEHKINNAANTTNATSLTAASPLTIVTLNAQTLGEHTKTFTATGCTISSAFNGQLNIDAVTAPTTVLLKFTVKQDGGNDASNPALLKAALSYVQFTKIG